MYNAGPVAAFVVPDNPSSRLPARFVHAPLASAQTAYEDLSLTTPCTTACSPNMITFPGAETVTSSSSFFPSSSSSLCARAAVAGEKPRVVVKPLTSLSIALDSPRAPARLTARLRSSIHRAGDSSYSLAVSLGCRALWARLCWMAPAERRDASRSSIRSRGSSIPTHSRMRFSGSPRSARTAAEMEACLFGQLPCRSSRTAGRGHPGG